MNKCFDELSINELERIDGGIAITLLGVTVVGWKAVATIAAGVTVLAGAGAAGFYFGYK